MALAIATITESIAGLNITGVTVKDKDELKEGWDAYDCPLLTPLPNGFVSNLQIVPANFGTGTSRKLDVSYNLTYRFFYKPVGSGNLEKTWSDMVEAVYRIFDAILENDALTGLIDLSLAQVTDFGAVQDGSNNLYHGCDITLRVMEFVN